MPLLLLSSPWLTWLLVLAQLLHALHLPHLCSSSMVGRAPCSSHGNSAMSCTIQGKKITPCAYDEWAQGQM
ncbi:hypothetical protein Zm00014a_008741 [Zea mays]|uniref:Uncharacterized protein n=1 Tax=Zea mays TaxID=4577 RepID=A0A3L6EAU0_MAIZE|nr:hypothetical protein Zm00014a_008741 [Zea mays]